MDMTSMHPITAETAHERKTRAMPVSLLCTMSSDDLGVLLSSLEYDGEWELAELVEAELNERDGSES